MNLRFRMQTGRLRHQVAKPVGAQEVRIEVESTTSD